MQKRHTDPKQYFQELATTTEKYLIPIVEQILPIKQGMKVAEVGCSIGGNLEPFLKRGCAIYGIDIDPHRIHEARQLLLSKTDQVHFFICDFLDLEDREDLRFDLIILRDVIEHIEDKDRLFSKLKQHLTPTGIIYIAFPPWRMPFGGHQQICRTYLSKLPWLHLLPSFLYFGMMKMAGETEGTIQILRENRATGFSIFKYKKLVRKNNFSLISEINYFINPHYEAKFNLKPRILPRFLTIPWLSDFYITAHSSFVKPN